MLRTKHLYLLCLTGVRVGGAKLELDSSCGKEGGGTKAFFLQNRVIKVTESQKRSSFWEELDIVPLVPVYSEGVSIMG